jgi:hypothetical protein
MIKEYAVLNNNIVEDTIMWDDTEGVLEVEGVTLEHTNGKIAVIGFLYDASSVHLFVPPEPVEGGHTYLPHLNIWQRSDMATFEQTEEFLADFETAKQRRQEGQTPEQSREGLFLNYPS